MENAKIKVLRFDSEDVIATSGCPMPGMSTESYQFLYQCHYYLDLDGSNWCNSGDITGGKIQNVYDANGSLIGTFNKNDKTTNDTYKGQYFHYYYWEDEYEEDHYNIQFCSDSTHQHQ